MYDKIAYYYDLTHADLTDDIEYVVSLAVKVGGPVLELGCGSGRLLLPLARAGCQVTGVDNSQAMLARARDRIAVETESTQARITLVEADMTAVSVDGGEGQFGLAVIPYNTFMHLATKDALRALKRIQRQLQPGGLLFIDLINPWAVADTPDQRGISLESQLVDPETGDIVLQMASNWLDEHEQQLHITWIYDVCPAGGGPVQRTVANASYHYRYPHQLELLLADAKFKLSSLSGEYDGAPFAEESERLLLLATAI